MSRLLAQMNELHHGRVKSSTSDPFPDSLIRLHGAQRRCDKERNSAATLPCHARNAWQLVTLIKNFLFFFFLDSFSSSASNSFFFLGVFTLFSLCCLPEETGRKIPAEEGKHHFTHLHFYDYIHFTQIEKRATINWVQNSNIIHNVNIVPCRIN